MNLEAYKLFLGICLLLSSDFVLICFHYLTNHLINEEKYNKPFFTCYLENGVFMIYLILFFVWNTCNEKCKNFANFENNPKLKYSPLNQTEKKVDYETKTCQNREAYNKTKDDETKLNFFITESTWEPIAFLNENNESINSINEKETSSYSDCLNKSFDDSKSSIQKTKNINKKVKFADLIEVRYLTNVYVENAFLSRLSYKAFFDATSSFNQYNASIIKSFRLASVLALILFFSNYLLLLSENYKFKSNFANLSSGFSSIFSIILQIPLLNLNLSSEKFTLSKLLLLLLNFLGLYLINFSIDLNIIYETNDRTFSHITNKDNFIDNPKIIFSVLLSSFLIAIYLTILKNKVDKEEDFDIPMFLGFIGFFNAIFLFIVIYYLDYMNLETFQLPNRNQFILIIIKGFIGCVLNHLLWICGCFLTTTLISFLSLSFLIPLKNFLFFYFTNTTINTLFMVGLLFMLISFLSIIYLSFYENLCIKNLDPLLDLSRKLVKSKIHKKLQKSETCQKLFSNEVS